MRVGSPSGSATMCCSQAFSKSVLGANTKSISFLSLYCRAVFSGRTSFVFTFSRDFAAKRRTRRHAEGTGFTKPNGKGVVGPDAPQPAGLEAEAAEIETCRG